MIANTAASTLVYTACHWQPTRKKKISNPLKAPENEMFSGAFSIRVRMEHASE